MSTPADLAATIQQLVGLVTITGKPQGTSLVIQAASGQRFSLRVECDIEAEAIVDPGAPVEADGMPP